MPSTEYEATSSSRTLQIHTWRTGPVRPATPLDPLSETYPMIPQDTKLTVRMQGKTQVLPGTPAINCCSMPFWR